MKFDRRLGSIAAEMFDKLQSDPTTVNPYLAALKCREI